MVNGEVVGLSARFQHLLKGGAGCNILRLLNDFLPWLRDPFA
jgi:hypothetical protein